MKNRILATVSVVALVCAFPALADSAKTQTDAEASTTGNIVHDAEVAIDNIKEDSVEAYQEIKATLMGKEKSDKNIQVVIDSRKTASGIIGHNVYNEKQESVARVSDIILDKEGNAKMVVVSEGMFTGLGKLAAFDYSAITRVESDGDVIMPLSEKIIENAAAFSYDKADSNGDVRVIPENGYSVAKLLEGQLIDQDKKPVADIEDISFKNGVANQLIVSFGKVLGLGGDKAVFSFDDATIVRDNGKLDFQLSASKAGQFEAFKKTLTE